MITLSAVRKGYDSGLIRLVESPNEDGIVCAIGDCWFYFGGITAEEYDNVEEYKKNIPVECITEEIFNTLDDFWRCGYEEFRDEYLYYEYFLLEHGVMS